MGTKNKLTDLNNLLFAQLERLDDEELTAEQLELEIKRAKAVGTISSQLVAATQIALDAAKLRMEYGEDSNLQFTGLLEDKH